MLSSVMHNQFKQELTTKNLIPRSFGESLTRFLIANNLYLINGFEVISSSMDKSKLIAMNFASHFTLDNKGNLPAFPFFHRAEILTLHYLGLWKFPDSSKTLTMKAMDTGKIPVVVLNLGKVI